MSQSTRIVLADDHAILRDMLAERLDLEPDFEIVAAVPDAEQALAVVSAQPVDLLVLDIDMPGLSPFSAARQVRDEHPSTRVVFLSAYLRDGYLAQALAVEAAGYLVKEDAPEAIVDGLRRAARGRIAFSPAVRARLVAHQGSVALSGTPAGRLSLLTPRELEVLRYLASGLSRKELARTMQISAKTVEQHCDHLMQKLGIHDRVELARFAIREGLVEP
jgi:DNA-binding NarL/FixJ family response regulator